MTNFGNIDLNQIQKMLIEEETASPEELKSGQKPPGISDSVSKMEGKKSALFTQAALDAPRISSPRFELLEEADLKREAPTEKELQKMLDELPEASALKSLMKQQGFGSEEEMTNYLTAYLKQHEARATEHGVRALTGEGLSNFIARLIEEGRGLPSEVEERLYDLRESSMIAAIAEKEPSLLLMLSALKKDYTAKGKSEEEAAQLASSQLMHLLESELEGRGLPASKIGVTEAASAAVSKLLDGMVRTDSSELDKGVSTGLKLGADIEKLLVNFSGQVGSINPSEEAKMGGVALSMAQSSMNGSLELVKELIALVKNDPTIPNSERVLMMDFLKQIAKMIADLKAVLVEIEMSKNEKSKEYALAQSEASDQRRERTLQKLQKQLDQIRKARGMKKFALAMKIIGPILGVAVGAIAIIIGAVLAPFTGATSLIISIVIAIAVMALVTALIVTLSETGVMEKGFTALNKAIADVADAVTGSNAPEWVQKLAQIAVWTTIIAALVAAALLVSILSAGTASSAAIMVLTQISLTILQHSKVVETAVRAVGEPLGADDNQIMIASMVIGTAAALAIGIGTAIGGIAGAARHSGGTVGNVASKASSKMTELSKKLESLLKLQGLTDKLDDIAGTSVKQLQDNTYKLRTLSAMVQMGSTALMSGASIYQGYIKIEEGQMKKEEGELDALIELLKDLIKTLEDILERVGSDIQQSQESGSKERQQYEGLAELFDQIIQQWTDMLNQITQAADTYAGRGGGHAA